MEKELTSEENKSNPLQRWADTAFYSMQSLHLKSIARLTFYMHGV